jgi:hypothetical protein
LKVILGAILIIIGAILVVWKWKTLLR